MIKTAKDTVHVTNNMKEGGEGGGMISVSQTGHITQTVMKYKIFLLSLLVMTRFLIAIKGTSITLPCFPK